MRNHHKLMAQHLFHMQQCSPSIIHITPFSLLPHSNNFVHKFPSQLQRVTAKAKATHICRFQKTKYEAGCSREFNSSYSPDCLMPLNTAHMPLCDLKFLDFFHAAKKTKSPRKILQVRKLWFFPGSVTPQEWPCSQALSTAQWGLKKRRTQLGTGLGSCSKTVNKWVQRQAKLTGRVKKLLVYEIPI